MGRGPHAQTRYGHLCISLQCLPAMGKGRVGKWPSTALSVQEPIQANCSDSQPSRGGGKVLVSGQQRLHTGWGGMGWQA